MFEPARAGCKAGTDIYIKWIDWLQLVRHIELFSKQAERPPEQRDDNDENPVQLATRIVNNKPVEILFAIVGDYKPTKCAYEQTCA